MPKFIAILLCAVGAIAAFFCGREIWWQDRVRHAFVSTSAIVTKSNIPGLAGRPQVTYEPTIEYQFTRNGSNHVSTRIWPYGFELHKPEVDAWARQYAVGKIVTAYVNPRNSSDAVLLRSFDLWPYWPTAGAIILIAVGIGGFTRVIRPKRKKMQAIRVDNSGWHRLAPAKNFSERRREVAYLLVSIGVPLALLSWHLRTTPSPWDDGRRTFVILSAIIFLVLLSLLARTIWLTLAWGDLTLLVDQAPMRRGEPFSLRAEAEALSRKQLNEVRAHIVCTRRNLLHLGRRTVLQSIVHGERTMYLAGKTILLGGETLKGTADTFFARHNWPESGREGISMYPYNLWEVRIELIGPGKQIAATFPLDVI